MKCVEANFTLLANNTDLEVGSGFIYVTKANGGVITCPGGLCRQSGNGYTGQVLLLPQVISTPTTFTAQARFRQMTSADEAVIGYLLSYQNGNTYYQVTYDTANGWIALIKYVNGSNSTGGGAVALTKTINIGNANEVLIRAKVLYNTALTSCTISLYYSNIVSDSASTGSWNTLGLSWTLIGTYTDNSPLPPNQNVGLFANGSNNQSDTTGLQMGDIVVTTTSFYDGVVTYGTTKTNGTPYIVLSPPGVSPSTQLPVVYNIHGSGRLAADIDPTNSSTTPGATGMNCESASTFSAILSMPARIVACDASGPGQATPNNWGNPGSITDWIDTIEQTEAAFACGLQCVFSGSMGAMDTCILINRGVISPSAVYLLYPATSLYENYYAPGSNGGFIQAAVNTAFGITGSGNNTYALLTAGSDPQTLPFSQYGREATSWRILSSSGDTVIPKATNEDFFINNLSQYSSDLTYLATAGDHGDFSNNRPQDLFIHFYRKVNAPNPGSVTKSTSTGSALLHGSSKSISTGNAQARAVSLAISTGNAGKGN